MFDGRFRHGVDGVTAPIGKALASLGVTADVLTAAGLAMSVGAAVAIGVGNFAVGLVLMVATGLPDLLDGPVAKAAGTVSVRGAFLDSVADRVSDGFLYGGLAWYLAAHHHGTAVMVPVAIVAVTGLISYERAKAELLGLAARGGLMERAERFIALGLILMATAVDSALLAPLLAVFLVLVTATAGGRFVRVWRAATAVVAERGAEGPTRPAAVTDEPVVVAAEADQVTDPLPETMAVRWRRGRVDSRWRAWRAARARPAARPRLHGAAGRPAELAHRSPLVQRRSGEPWGRWRARRAGLPVSRAGGVRRERRAARVTGRPGRRTSSGNR